METFQEAGVQMLKEFRALLQHSPLPLPGTRLLQLLALNMFAIESTQLKGESSIFLFFSSLFLLFIWSSPLSFSRRFSVTKHDGDGGEFSSFPGETWRMETESFWNSRLLSWNYSCRGEGYRCELCVTLRMESIRLPIRDLNLDGFSRAEVREVSHIYRVEGSRKCSGIFNFFSFHFENSVLYL